MGILKVFTIAFGFFALLFQASQVFAVSFTIANPKVDKEVISVDVSLSGLTSSSCASSSCYLQAGMKASAGGQYFGYTKNTAGNWIEYSGSTTKDVITSTFYSFSPTSGSWNGTLSVKANPLDMKYHGPGLYIMKAWRYSGSSDGSSGDSNELNIDIIEPTLIPTSTLSPSPTSTPSNTPTPTNTPTNTSTLTPTLKLTTKPTTKPTSTPTKMNPEDMGTTTARIEIGEGEVLGTEIENHVSSASGFSQKKPWIIGILFIGGGLGFLSVALVLHKQFFPKQKSDILEPT